MYIVRTRGKAIIGMALQAIKKKISLVIIIIIDINFDQLLKPSHQNSQKGCGQENVCAARIHLINLPQTKSPK